MAEIVQKLITPSVPNFIFMEAPPGKRQDGVNFDRLKVSIADLSDETLEELARDWKNDLLKRAYELRKEKS
jgi:predicted phosphoribosyltransferase